MLKFLKDIHEALDKNCCCDTVVSFYIDFGKAFDRVPHYEQLENESSIGLEAALDMFCDYLKRQTRHVRVGNTLSHQLEIAFGVPQGSLVCFLSFCVSINDLRFTEI